MGTRQHQTEAKAAIRDHFDIGCRRQLISMATGTGKTYVFAEASQEMKDVLPGKTLVLAHTEELVNQSIETFKTLYPHLVIDKEMAEHKADPSNADVIVASVASLGRKGNSRLAKYDISQWDKVIVDEAHHSPATSYQLILNHFDVLRPDSHKLLLGVTATTKRVDGKALSDTYHRISYVYGMRQAISDGWLVDIVGYRVNTDTDLDSIGKTDGDLKVEELADKINNPARNAKVVQAWKDLGQNRRTVVFAANVAHAQALADSFKEAGVLAEAIWGEDAAREQKIKDHKDGKFPVLINVGILVEGYDDWQIGCIVLARPTESESRFTQMTGRGTRLQEGTENLKTILADPKNYSDGFFIPTIKTDCILIDVVDNTTKHSLMTVPTLMGLPTNLDLKGHSLLKTVEAIEAAQAEHPEVDFSKLKAADELASYIESIDLFAVKFPPETEKCSDFKWNKAMDGGFVIRIPSKSDEFKPGRVTVKQNMLNKWEVDGTIKDKSFHGIRDNFESAIAIADTKVRELMNPKLLPLIARKAAWHDKPIDWKGPQAKLLHNLYPGKSFPENFTKGQASFWIDKVLAKKGKK